MIERLLHRIRQMIGTAIAAIPQARWGTVESVDPARPAIKARLWPENVLSGWLPVAQSSAGGTWSLLAPISPGSQVFLVPELGTPGHDFVATGFAHSDKSQPPKVANGVGTGGAQSTNTAPWAADECLLVHQSGSVVRLCSNGDIYLRPASKLLGVDGDVVVNGNLFVRQSATIEGAFETQGDATMAGSLFEVPNLPGVRPPNPNQLYRNPADGDALVVITAP